jgi:tryptophan synthase beta subunit
LANPKGQANKAGEVKDEEVVAETPAESAQVATSPLDEVLGQAQRAYSAYMDATREVSRIYRENEIQVGEAYLRVVQQANEACESAIKQANKNREPEKLIREQWNKQKKKPERP